MAQRNVGVRGESDTVVESWRLRAQRAVWQIRRMANQIVGAGLMEGALWSGFGMKLEDQTQKEATDQTQK